MDEELLAAIQRGYEKRKLQRAWEAECGGVKELITRIGAAIAFNYEIVDFIDVGSSGIVLKVSDRALHVPRALKFPRPKMEQERVVRIFRGEVEKLTSLHHQGVMKVYFQKQVQLDEVEYPFFVMEYIEHISDLAKLLDNRRLTAQVLIDILRQVVQAMQYVHSRQIIHCDLKPANIMVAPLNGSGWSALVADLGYAKNFVSNPEPERFTVMTFTEKYAHPDLKELIRKAGSSDPNARQVEIPYSDLRFAFDLYAVGMTILEMLDAKLDRIGFSEYEVRYLQIIAARLLDGRLPPPTRKGIPGLGEKALNELKYSNLSECALDIEKGLRI